MKYGFVLGGGGAKALSQIGAIAQLELSGIFPSYLAGTSMGAVHAVLLACGMTSYDLYKFYENHSTFQLFSIDISKETMINNKKLGRVIADYCNSLGYYNLEDLPIKTVICVTDNETNKPVYLTRGNIYEAIRSSAAALFSRRVVIEDEEIKKQVCEQTGREYTKGMHIVLKDGCYTANVPFEGLDFIRSEEQNKFFDICFDVVPNYIPSFIKVLNDFNKFVLFNDQTRKQIFEQTRNGVYMEFANTASQATFNKRALNNLYELGKTLVFEKYLEIIDKSLDLTEQEIKTNNNLQPELIM